MSILNKYAHLLEPGRIVHTVDTAYRVTAKFKTPDGFAYKLASLDGKPVPMPENFRPVTASYAKLAQWMRFVVAYNRDFDSYVKEYIKAAGLPVDNTMNWSKFLQAKVAPKLYVPTTGADRDADKDEAIHWLIITMLGQRRKLEKGNPEGFFEKIKTFNDDIQALPLDKQVTKFLMNVFASKHALMQTNEYIREQMFMQDTDSMWGEGDDEYGADESGSLNLIDENNTSRTSPDHTFADARVDIERIGDKFEQWLGTRISPKVAPQYRTMYDLWWEHALNEPMREHVDSLVKPNDLHEEFSTATGKSQATFKVIWSQLPKLIEEYSKVAAAQGQDVTLLNMMVRDMTSHGKGEGADKPALVHASSLKTAAPEDEEHHHEDITDAGLKHEDEGLWLRLVYLPNGNLDVQATQELKNEFAANEDWVPTIYELFEDFTANGWEWIRPVDIGALTDGDIITDPDGHIFWHERYQIEDPVEELKTAGHYTMLAGGGLDDTEAPSDEDDSLDKTSADEDGDEEQLDKQVKEVEEDQKEHDDHASIKTIIADVINSGLFEKAEDPYFTWSGCQYCGDDKGANVTDIEGYRNLDEAHKGEEHKFEFAICDDCFNKLYNGESNDTPA